jgi:alkyldihydroxyacetonephosphate synthase
MNSQKLRWWGWGTLDKTYPLENRPAFWPFVQRELGLTGQESFPVPDAASIALRPPRLTLGELATLEQIVGVEGVSIEHEARLTHALGKSYRDLVRLRLGQVPNPPDAVVWPQDGASEEQVASILQWAAEQRIAVVPFGGGSSVTGGVETLERPGQRGVLSLDLARMNRLLALDLVSRTATVQAGILGPDLERALNAQGFMLGHFPQSFEFSALGGWIATRSAGQSSTGYGKIEDMVVSLRVVTPAGIVETRVVPASAAGPELKALLIGSEGVFGVITQAVLKIHPLPMARDYRGLLFRSFSDGLAAIREVLQSGLAPAVVRLSDNDETRSSLALREPPTGRGERLKETLGLRLLARRGHSLETGCLLILGCEGAEEVVRETGRAARAICQAHGAFDLGHGAGRSWLQERFALPYLRDVLLDRGVMTDTLETATTWDKLETLYSSLKAAIASAIETSGVQPWVMAHVSHCYPQGASLYFTFLAKQTPGREIEQWLAIKKAATDCIMQNGGTLSHHHGVGYEHAPWLEAEDTAPGVAALRAVKRSLDPPGIMNPGKLFPK